MAVVINGQRPTGRSHGEVTARYLTLGIPEAERMLCAVRSMTVPEAAIFLV
jgi:hypothetical protein